MAFLQNNMAARKKAPAKPEAVPVNTICSVCGLPWSDHGRDPNTDDCIRLLKAELAKRVQYVPIQIPVPYPRPTRPWYWEDWYSRPHRRKPYEITCGTNESGSYQKSVIGGTSYNERTPRLLCTTTSPSM